jgi:hypothetical protein
VERDYYPFQDGTTQFRDELSSGDVNSLIDDLYLRLSIYDVLEDAFVDGNDTAYASSWNGNINAPSMNAVYDEFVALAGDYLAIDGSNADQNISIGIYDFNTTGTGTFGDANLTTGDLNVVDGNIVMSDGSRIGYTGGVGMNFDQSGNDIEIDGKLGVGGDPSTYDISAIASISGGDVTINAENTSNTADSRARMRMFVGGANAGDAMFTFGTQAVTTWTFGLDNDDGDSFVLANTATLGSGNAMVVDTSENVDFPGGNVIVSAGNLDVVGLTTTGDGDGNDSDFEADGTLHFGGDATVWEDLRVPISAVRIAGAAPAAEQAYKSGIVLAFDTLSDDYCYFTAQIPHSYKEGTDLEAHLHWAIPTAGGGAATENVKWDLTYSWSNIGAAIPNASSVTLTVDVNNTNADEHLMDEWTTISGTGKTISSMLICSLKRDTGVASDYGNDVYLMEIDFHYEIDTIGSRTETVK